MAELQRFRMKWMRSDARELEQHAKENFPLERMVGCSGQLVRGSSTGSFEVELLGMTSSAGLRRCTGEKRMMRIAVVNVEHTRHGCGPITYYGAKDQVD